MTVEDGGSIVSNPLLWSSLDSMNNCIGGLARGSGVDELNKPPPPAPANDWRGQAPNGFIRGYDPFLGGQDPSAHFRDLGSNLMQGPPLPHSVAAQMMRGPPAGAYGEPPRCEDPRGLGLGEPSAAEVECRDRELQMMKQHQQMVLMQQLKQQHMQQQQQRGPPEEHRPEESEDEIIERMLHMQAMQQRREQHLEALHHSNEHPMGAPPAQRPPQLGGANGGPPSVQEYLALSGANPQAMYPQHEMEEPMPGYSEYERARAEFEIRNGLQGHSPRMPPDFSPRGPYGMPQSQLVAQPPPQFEYLPSMGGRMIGGPMDEAEFQARRHHMQNELHAQGYYGLDMGAGDPGLQVPSGEDVVHSDLNPLLWSSLGALKFCIGDLDPNRLPEDGEEEYNNLPEQQQQQPVNAGHNDLSGRAPTQNWPPPMPAAPDFDNDQMLFRDDAGGGNQGGAFKVPQFGSQSNTGSILGYDDRRRLFGALPNSHALKEKAQQSIQVGCTDIGSMHGGFDREAEYQELAVPPAVRRY